MSEYTQWSRPRPDYPSRVILMEKRSKLDDWYLDDEGTIGHDCNYKINQGEEPLFFGKTFKGFNAGLGRFERTCVNCGVTAPKELEFQSRLRRLRR